MAERTFLTAYQTSKLLSGVVGFTKRPRPLALTQHIGSETTSLRETVNFDKEFDIKNVMGQFVAPTIRASGVQLPNFGTQELSFAYSKELVTTPDFSQISQRQMGQDFGTQQNLRANYEALLAKGAMFAEQRMENLEELITRDLLYYGKYTTNLAGAGEKHPLVTYDFNRPVYDVTGTTQAVRDTNKAAVLRGEVIAEVNLTSLKANTATDVAGGMSWDSKDSTNNNATVTPQVAVDPIDHVRIMVRNARQRMGCARVYMSADAWSWYHKAFLSDKYKDLRDLTNAAQPKLDPMLLEKEREIEGLTHVGYVLEENGFSTLPIYVYEGVYHDRETGVRTAYTPNGYVLCVPPASYGMRIYGRIMHPKANWLPQKRWINFWVNEETGLEQYEMHSNFLIGHADIESVIAWKVCSSAVAL